MGDNQALWNSKLDAAVEIEPECIIRLHRLVAPSSPSPQRELKVQISRNSNSRPLGKGRSG